MDEATLFRVQCERDELEIKIRKLNEFMDCEAFNKLDDKNQRLLSSQLSTMESYHHILCKRIFLMPMPLPKININDLKYEGMK